MAPWQKMKKWNYKEYRVICKIKMEQSMETSTKSSYKKAFRLIIERFEGIYSNDPDDPGGETYMGISRKMNAEFEGWKIIDSFKGKSNYTKMLQGDLQLEEMVEGFYKENYWDKFKGDVLGEETGEEMLDQSVNMGVGRAVEHLQRSLNILNDGERLYRDITVDGKMGEQTYQAYKACCHERGEAMLVNYLNAYQGKYYIELMEKRTIFEKFTGLFKRVTIN